MKTRLAILFLAKLSLFSFTTHTVYAVQCTMQYNRDQRIVVSILPYTQLVLNFYALPSIVQNRLVHSLSIEHTHSARCLQLLLLLAICTYKYDFLCNLLIAERSPRTHPGARHRSSSTKQMETNTDYPRHCEQPKRRFFFFFFCILNTTGKPRE